MTTFKEQLNKDVDDAVNACITANETFNSLSYAVRLNPETVNDTQVDLETAQATVWQADIVLKNAVTARNEETTRLAQGGTPRRPASGAQANARITELENQPKEN